MKNFENLLLKNQCTDSDEISYRYRAVLAVVKLRSSCWSFELAAIFNFRHNLWKFLHQTYSTNLVHISNANRTVVGLFILQSSVTSLQPNWRHICHCVIFDKSKFENFFLQNQSTNQVQISYTYRTRLGLYKVWSSNIAIDLATFLEFSKFFWKIPKNQLTAQLIMLQFHMQKQEYCGFLNLKFHPPTSNTLLDIAL